MSLTEGLLFILLAIDSELRARCRCAIFCLEEKGEASSFHEWASHQNQEETFGRSLVRGQETCAQQNISCPKNFAAAFQGTSGKDVDCSDCVERLEYLMASIKARGCV